MTNPCLRLYILVALIFAGCTKTGPPDPGFFMGGFATRTPLRPEVRFVTPGGPVETKPLKKVACVIEVVPPDGGEVPTQIEVCVCKGEKVLDRTMFKPSAFDGRVYTLRSKPRAPDKPGLYRLRIDSIYVIQHPESGEIQGEIQRKPGDANGRIAFSEWGPTVEVKR